MRMLAPGIVLVGALAGVNAAAQVASAPEAPAPAAPQQPSPDAQQPTAAPAVPSPVVPPAPTEARSFKGSTGIIFNAVRPERVVDFELVIGYLQAALEKSTNPGVREQARGWRMFKSAEPGPNGTVLYVFLIDPAVPGAEYALGPILAEEFPDQIQQIWKLYQGALAGPGSQTLLNLTPVMPPPLPPSGVPPAAAPAPEPRPGPPPGTPQ